MARRSTRPIISLSVAKPISAMISRSSSATKKKKLITCSGWPVKRARSTGSWVATPTGQVLRWHLRIMMQPAAISGAVAKPPIPRHSDAGAQAVEQQGLLGLGQADLPGRAGVGQGGQWRGPRAAL